MEELALPARNVGLVAGVPVKRHDDEHQWKVQCPICKEIQSPVYRECSNCVFNLVEELKHEILELKFLCKNLRRQNHHQKDSLLALRDEIYKYWHRELVDAGVENPVDVLPRQFVKLLQERERWNKEM